MHVEVDDGDACDAELVLCVARGDRDVAEDAEAHRLRLEGMVPRRTHEREAAGLRCPDRAACGEERRFTRGRYSVRIRIEPHLGLDRLDLGDVSLRMDTADLLARGGRSVHVPRERVVQHSQATSVLGAPGVVTPMELGERGMADHVHVCASSNRRATCSSPSSRACAAAESHSGTTSGSGGSGASRSIVAMLR